MIVDRSQLRTVLATWLAAVGAGAAWAGQLVFGYFVADAACADGTRHWGLDIKVWDGIISLVAFGLAGVALATGFLLWRAVTREPDVDPRGRVSFLGFWGIVGGLFFVALIVMTAIGILWLEQCRQG